MSQELVTQQPSISDMERMASAIVKSSLFGVKTVDQALALMIVAAAEGKHPGSVAAEYHIIQGKASLRSDAMLARFQQSGGKVEWHDHTDTQVSATFSHPQGGSLRVDWDMKRAKAAGIDGKDNWKKYPRQMLRARVVSEGVRAVFPAVLQGLYTPEEVGDFAAPAAAAASRHQEAAPKEKPVEIKVESTRVEAEAEVIDAEVVEETPWYAPVEDKIAEHGDAATLFLIAKDIISDGMTWKDVPEGSYRERILAHPDKFIAAVTK